MENNQPLIIDIQRFSIHDGPGIRSVVFFKGCNFTCPWCQNPESIALKPEIGFYPDKCIDTKDCGAVCDQNAIDFSNPLRIDRELCTACGKCAKACVSGGLKQIGQEYTVDMVLKELLQDLDYYKTSGGGVTFSGGEPTLHMDFIYELLKECKAAKLHTNIETNGYFSWDKFEKLLPLLDLIYFDIKILDEVKHKVVHQGTNERIYENIKRLLEVNAPVEFRIPLIPTFTSTEENLKEIVSLLKQNGIGKIHLLPYHSMGEGKAEKIGSTLGKLNLKPYGSEELSEIQNQFESQKIETVLYR